MLREKEEKKSDTKGGKKNTDTQSCLVSLLSGLKLYSQTNKCIKILIKKKIVPVTTTGRAPLLQTHGATKAKKERNRNRK